MSESLKFELFGILSSRRGTIGAAGLVDVTRTYRLRRLVPATNETAVVTEGDIVACPLIPHIGDAYSQDKPDLLVSTVTWQERDCEYVDVDVSYSIRDWSAIEAKKIPRGQDIESLTWSASTVTRDAVNDVKTGEMILNSAGQPFESVPQIDVPAPTWTKVVKTTERKTAWLALNGTINAAEVTVGGRTCAAHTVRVVSVEEDRLWDDDFGFRFKYSISLQVLNNPIKLGYETSETDIGWDIAIVDVGTMERDESNNLVKITAVNGETGASEYVTTPVLLDGAGHAPMRGEDDQPFAIRFQIYPEATLPEELLTETPVKYRQVTEDE